MSDPLGHYGPQPARLLCPWDSPGMNTRVGYHALLKGIFSTQESNPHLLHWQASSLPLASPGKPSSDNKFSQTYAYDCELYWRISLWNLGTIWSDSCWKIACHPQGVWSLLWHFVSIIPFKHHSNPGKWVLFSRRLWSTQVTQRVCRATGRFLL